ncbi:MAG: hypothetical protein E7378_00935 [Clostridiales bacterium]|nr:hypothetical protein [Clostridiales bacterium]
MKKKFSFILNIATICLCVCALAIGVWSAKNANLAVSGNVGFTANHCNANVELKIENAALGAADAATTPLYVQNSGGLSDTQTEIIINGADKTINIPTIYFTDMPNLDTPEDIVFTYTIENTSNFPIVAYLEIGPEILRVNSLVRADWDIMGGTILVGETLVITLTLELNTTSSFPSNINLNSSILSLKLEKAAEGKAEDYTYTTTYNTYNNEDGSIAGTSLISGANDYYITGVPTKTTNDTLTIPAVIKQTDGSYVKIKGVGGAKSLVYLDDYEEYHTLSAPVANIDAYTNIVVSNGIERIMDVALACGEWYYSEYNSGIYLSPSSNQVESFTLSKTLSYLGYAPFECSQGYTLILPNSLKDVSSTNFETEFEGSNLTSIYFGYGIDVLDSGLFNCHYTLEYVFIPGSAWVIGEGCFNYCTSLTEVDIDEGVTTIYADAFLGVPVTLNLPSTIDHIIEPVTSSNPYEEYSSLCINYFSMEQRATLDHAYAWIIGDAASLESTDIIIPDGVTRIGYHAFGEQGITSAHIPDSVQMISGYAFNGNEGLVITGTLTGWAYADGENSTEWTPVGTLTGEMLSYSLSDKYFKRIS